MLRLQAHNVIEYVFYDIIITAWPSESTLRLDFTLGGEDDAALHP